MIVKLNARTVESLKPTSKRMDYHDTEARGLTLRVTPNGVKTWSVLYRHRGKLRRRHRVDVLERDRRNLRHRERLNLLVAERAELGGAKGRDAGFEHRRNLIGGQCADLLGRERRHLRRLQRADLVGRQRLDIAGAQTRERLRTNRRDLRRAQAARQGVSIAGSEIVGLVPADALLQVAAETLKLEHFDASRVFERCLEEARIRTGETS